MRNIPRYERLKQLLKEKLASGQLKVGDRFYSQNELMKKYDLSFATVTRALNELEHEGYLVREQGRGTFVQAIPGQSGEIDVRPRNVAVFIPWDFRSPAHVNFQKIYITLEAEAPANYQLKLIPCSSDPSDMERYLFSREPLDGVIFVYPNEQHMGIISKLASVLPTVVIGHAVEGNISYVQTDNAAAAEIAVNYLIENGHENIGLISGALEMTDSKERLEGYRKALRSHGIAFSETLVVYTHPLELNGYSGLIDLFDRNSHIDITAVFCAGDLIAMGALAASRSMHKQIPTDLSIIGFDDIDEAERLDPPLSTIHVPIVELAQNAMSILKGLLDGTGSTVKTQLPAFLVERNTVRNLKQAEQAPVDAATAK